VMDDWEGFQKWVNDNYQSNYRLIQDLDDKLSTVIDDSGQSPVRAGFTADEDAMARINPNHIEALEVEGRTGAPVEHIADEAELRFQPGDVRLLPETTQERIRRGLRLEGVEGYNAVRMGDEVTIEFGPHAGKTVRLVGSNKDYYVVRFPGSEENVVVTPPEISYQGHSLEAPQHIEFADDAARAFALGEPGVAERVRAEDAAAEAAREAEVTPTETPGDVAALAAADRRVAQGPREPTKPPPPLNGRDFDPWRQSSKFGSRKKLLGIKTTRLFISISGQLGNSLSPFMRQFNSIMANNAVPSGHVQPQTATEWAMRTFEGFTGQMWRGVRPAFTNWAKKRAAAGTGRRFGRWRFAEFDEFLDSLGPAMRRMDDIGDAEIAVRAEDFDPDVLEAAQFLRKLFEEVRLTGRRHGLLGLEAERNYFPRVISGTKMQRWEHKETGIGEENMKQLWAKGLRAANPELDEAVIQRYAYGYLQVARNTDRHNDLQRSAILNGAAKEDMRGFMQGVRDEAGQKWTDDDIEGFLRFLAKDDEGHHLTSFSRRRNAIDEKVDITVPVNGKMTTVSIEDLLENDGAAAFEMYARQLVGASGMNMVMRELSRATGLNIDTVDRLQAVLRTDLEKHMRGASKAKINSELKKANVLINSLMGRRLQDPSVWSEHLMNLRLFNMMRLGGQFGIAQLPEFGTLVGSAGLKAMLRQMPELRNIFRQVEEGVTPSELGKLTTIMQELAVISGEGMTYQNSTILRNMDIDEAIKLRGIPDIGGNKLTRPLRTGARAQAILSAMLPIHVWQKRMVALLSSQKMFDLAKSRGGFGVGRRQMLGLDESDESIVVAAINKWAKAEDGMWGERLVAWNFAEWKNVDGVEGVRAMRLLLGALSRWSDRAIQENNIGNMSRWMTTDVGRLIAQFRNFVLVGYEKQMLSRVAMLADGLTGQKELAGVAVAEAASATFVATLAYVVQTHFNSIGMEEGRRKKFIADRMSEGKLFTVPVWRAGFASITPDAMNTAAHLLGFQSNLFTGRTASLPRASISVEGIGSNPSFDAINRAGSTLHAIGRSLLGATGITDDPVGFKNQKEYRDAMSLVPFNRSLLLINAFNAMGSGIPERKPRRKP
jgi:hypothetical protein